MNGAPEETDRARFRRTLLKVMLMQIASLLLLWWLQFTYSA